MYVCLCNGITERAVRAAGDAGARTLADLQALTGVAAACGSCADVAMQVLERHVEQRFPLQVFSVAA